MEICPICSRECRTSAILKQHHWRVHTEKGKNHKPMLGKNHIPWNKGLTKETDIRVLNLAEKLKGKQFGFKKGSKHSQETKDKISNYMKKAHAEGRAHNIGQSRWNNVPSYPEIFMMKVIENEFIDKNYKREVPFHRFSLDFLWEHKKKVIEIDGEQHERFEEQKQRDIEKDKLLKEEGYELLRIKWKDMFNDTKTYIKLAKEFIGKKP